MDPQWKQQARAARPQVFSGRRPCISQDEATLNAPRDQQSGPRKVALDGRKKMWNSSDAVKRERIEPWHPRISVRRQCEPCGLSRSGLSEEPRQESADHLGLMRLLDDQDTRTPYDGMRRMTAWRRTQGAQVPPTRGQQLLRLRALEALDQTPRLSPFVGRPQVSPSRLCGVPVERSNQVWSPAITDIRLLHGFIDVVAILA